MGFGFSKSFTIFLFISIVVWIGTKRWQNGFVLITIFAACAIIWKLFTK